MKNLKFYSILGLSALLVLGACKKEEITEDPGTGGESPVLTLSQTTMTVSADGGVASVAYQVSNPVDGASVTVDAGDVTWITDVDVTESTIDFTVEANSENDSRTATLTVSYPGAEDATLTVVQEAVTVDYDHEYELNCFSGSYNPLYGLNGEDLFYIWLSDIGFDDSGYAQTGGHYYNFYLFVDGAGGPPLPTGTYTYSTGSEDMTFYPYSRYVVQYDSYYDEVYLTGGSITVSADGDTYTIEGTVTDYNGEVHYVYYSGPAELEDNSMPDADFVATTAAPSYVEDYNQEYMLVEFLLTDMYYYGYGYTEPPGNAVVVDTYMPYDVNGKFTAGTYTVSNTYENMTIGIGDYSYYMYMESYYDYQYDDITSGTMTVTENNDGTYNVACDFGTYTGASVKCTYSGALEVDMPWYSTLKENVEVNIGSDVTAYASNFGDYFRNGGSNWYINIEPNGAGEGLIIDLNTDPNSAEEGIPSGTYTASSSFWDYPEVGEFYQSGTWYYDVDEYGNDRNSAPAGGGYITVTNNGDGTYKLEFECTDDAGVPHTWKGVWEGPISGTMSSSSSVSSVKPSASSMFKAQKSSKATERKAARKEAKFNVVSPNESRVNAMSKPLELKK